MESPEHQDLRACNQMVRGHACQTTTYLTFKAQSAVTVSRAHSGVAFTIAVATSLAALKRSLFTEFCKQLTTDFRVAALSLS